MKVPTATLEVKINAFTNGVPDGDLFSSQAKKLMTSFDDLLNRVEKYVTLEKIRKAKKTDIVPAQSERRRESKSREANQRIE